MQPVRNRAGRVFTALRVTPSLAATLSLTVAAKPSGGNAKQLRPRYTLDTLGNLVSRGCGSARQNSVKGIPGSPARLRNLYLTLAASNLR